MCVVALTGACAQPTPNDTAGLDRAERSIGKPGKVDAPPLEIGQVPVSWEHLRAPLAEAAGGVVIEEMILDHQARAELERQGLRISEKDIAAEREILSTALRRSAGAGPEQSARLITLLQQGRGLGPVRFAALLERNALLRRLVRDSVEIDNAAVDREVAVKYGERVRCRIIVVTGEAEAARVLARLKAAGDELPARFAAEARLVSVDPSGPRGGDVEPISPVDPSYAIAVRNAAQHLEPGQLSPIIVLDNGFAILLGQGRVEPVEPPAGAREEAEAEIRLRQERIAMDRLAQRLLNSAPVTVFDPALGWSWQVRVLKPGG